MEAVKEQRQLLRRDRLAGVADAQARLLSVLLQNQPQISAHGAKLDGVIEQVVDDLCDAVALGLDPAGPVGQLDVDVQALAVDLLLSEHMAELSSPVSKVFFARKTPQIDYLVDAGETALAARSMLAAPGMEQKAVLRSAWRQLSDLEVADGELPDNETAMIQVWRYAPVFADSSRVDNISLALSLAAIDDERIQLEVDRMFGKEYPWQEAL